MNIHAYWTAVLQQDAEALRSFFHPDAWINWHNTNEHFSAEEFIRANCEYPGEWDGEIEKLVSSGDQLITAVHVYTRSKDLHFHVTSFIQIIDGRIASVEEYWGDDGPAPQWRKDLQIGRPIRKE